MHYFFFIFLFFFRNFFCDDLNKLFFSLDVYEEMVKNEEKYFLSKFYVENDFFFLMEETDIKKDFKIYFKEKKININDFLHKKLEKNKEYFILNVEKRSKYEIDVFAFIFKIFLKEEKSFIRFKILRKINFGRAKIFEKEILLNEFKVEDFI